MKRILERRRLIDELEQLRKQMRGEDVARQDDGLAVGGPHPLHHEDVLARLQVELGGLAG